ncbi:hypothetical protein DUT91_14425 [Phyllobacterium salinisoli]|uniref:Glycosyltransferase family 8 protein n=1 Tax=Phyllobacterium salinisoli TaxID=1899321 RepID=A0A368K4P9_9HYPH|nr:hypothetical protein [Phyllobacterium salinisoli]RCS23463.1 hypothetical protein DUT91_14425 [Phyllobacterium salinisoli]
MSQEAGALGIRWTVGDVSNFGFEALRLSIWGAVRTFGSDAALAVVANSLPVEEARRRTGPVPNRVAWLVADGVPESLNTYLDGAMADGVAWKLAPPRVFPDRFELALDNDCILWDIPATIDAWRREKPPRCLIAADVKKAFGVFTEMTRPEPRNTGIRGFPPGFDLDQALTAVLKDYPVQLRSELDEQGLQAIALDHGRPAHIVPTEEVTICSPFWPHQPYLGRAGAHFVGLNARHLPWSYYDRPASEYVVKNWLVHRPEICRRIGLTEPPTR